MLVNLLFNVREILFSVLFAGVAGLGVYNFYSLFSSSTNSKKEK
jgi:hypothetical protein